MWRVVAALDTDNITTLELFDGAQPTLIMYIFKYNKIKDKILYKCMFLHLIKRYYSEMKMWSN